jgi:Leucine-rich repeat (LRR) protein
MIPGANMRTAVVEIGKLAFLAMMIVSTAHAGIPSSERTALLTLYGNTGGGNWTIRTNWPATGAKVSECSWFGVTCDGIGSQVVGIALPNNNLKGTLGAQNALTAFTNLQDVDVHSDSTSSTPNVLTGSIPALSSLKSLQSFAASGNKLNGTIPVLTGLTSLQSFTVDSNALTGVLPALTGLTNLQEFTASDNKLTSTIPALTGLTNLRTFSVADDQLTGSIPSFTGLTSLQYFLVDDNQLSLGIPALPATLIQFGAGNNRLTGNLPTFTGLPLLESFDAHNNQLDGMIPALSSLGSLEFFYVSGNQLTGMMPALSALTNLEAIALGGNSLTGPITAAPDNLTPGASSLCPNPLQTTPSGNDAKWNAATGLTHWYGTPFPDNECDDIFDDSFEVAK